MRRALLAALAATVAAGALLGRTRDTPDARGSAGARGPADVPAASDVALASGATDSSRAPLVRPRSLRGTRVDGGLTVDADGHFVPTLEARRLFDYFLTASGEVADDALRARLQHEIERRLPPAAAREATTLLERYLAYRERVRLLATASVPDDGDLEVRLATLIALRREVLGAAAAEVFFADEEADARRLLDTRRIANDPSLTAEERAARIEAIFAAAEADLPPDVRAARAAARRATPLRDAEAELHAHGGDDADLTALRERLVGAAAAARLAERDRARRDWQGRVDAFRAARDRVEHDATLTLDARAAAVARLLDETFTPAERRRVEALDRIAAGTPSAEP
jgi:lipase chaperone LimK